MIIYNVHSHTFTEKHVPSRFLPLHLKQILKPKIIRKPVSWLGRKLLPWERDFIERYMNFLDLVSNKNQEEVFETLRGYYPQGLYPAKFIVLPVDMHYMAAGKVEASMEQQHNELARLHKKYPNQVIPFVGVDPRRADDKDSENPLDTVKRYVEDHGFKGVKLYPPLGFYPTDPRLYPVYEYIEKHNLPVMSHCSRGGVFKKKVTRDMLKGHPRGLKLERKKAKEFTDYYTDPANYRKLLQDFPRLKVCLAHFGGHTEWDKYLFESWNPKDLKSEKSWLSEILDLIKEFPNLYTDISSTLFKTEDYFALLKVILEDPNYQRQVLFGSDFYMVERDRIRERDMSIKLRGYLGRELFKQIAETNPKMYLESVPPKVSTE